MKISISLPDPMAREIKALAEASERPVSWWLQRAWDLARGRLLYGDRADRAQQKALKKLASLRGSLKGEYPEIDSVTLAHQAFLPKK